MLVLVAVTLIIFLIAVVFSIDIAHMQLTRMELRSAVDAATRAAAESLSRQQDEEVALVRAKEVAALNEVAGQSFTLPDADVTFGRVNITLTGTSDFTAGETPPNAVQITSGRTNGRPDGNVGLFLGGILGTDSFEPVQTATAAQLDRDLALVLDRSGSMEGDKFTALNEAVNVFLDELDGTQQVEQVSITTYSGDATTIVELTPNTNAARTAMAMEVTGGGTAIGLGLEYGLDSLQNDPNRRPYAEPTIVLMTDGIHNEGIDPEDVAMTIPLNYQLHTITFGSGADQARMAALAQMRHGKHFHAPNNAALISIFREIAASLPVVMTE